jgi:bifunctional enzyme CysN/CysC
MNIKDQAFNIHKSSFSITRENREGLNGHPGMVVWLTGLSGSGKSTIANALEKRLYAEGRHTYILDGDNIRSGLCSDLGFSDVDRIENIRRITEVSKLMLDAGLVVITAFISPFRSERKIARELIGNDNFFEVYVKTPLAVCEQRDPKGLYKMARNGSLRNMTGIDSPYECPESPSAIIDTSSSTPYQVAGMLISAIKSRSANSCHLASAKTR